MTTLVVGSGATAENYEKVDFSAVAVVSNTAVNITLSAPGYFLTYHGSFQYDSDGYLYRSSYIDEIRITVDGQLVFEVTDFNISVAEVQTFSSSNDLFEHLFTGDDMITGSSLDDYLEGFSGADTIHGGLGDDVIDGGSGRSYLRGDEGNDIILGGDDFDDINGNMGADSISGGGGGDWVVGGKDNDLLFGDSGDDIVYGNLGNDTCYGDDGNDIVRGGKDNDVVYGGAGDDWLSGDKGDDTLTGGAGADVFHTFGEAGIDRVTDFNRAEGDRVMVDSGTVYTVAQVGADTVISMEGGGQMILVGVSMNSLTGDWIFGA